MKVEFMHDTIARAVYDKSSSEAKFRRQATNLFRRAYQRYLQKQVLLQQEDLDEIRPFRNQIPFSKEEEDFIRLSEQTLWRKRMWRILWVVLFILGLAIALVVTLFYYQDALKAKQETAEKNEELDSKNKELDRTIIDLNSSNKQLEKAFFDLEARGDSLTNAIDLALINERNAIVAKNDAIAARNDALRQAAIAEASRLASLSLQLGKELKLNDALQVALEAYNTVEAPKPTTIYAAFGNAFQKGIKQQVPKLQATLNHKGTVYSAKLSPDGTEVISNTRDKTFRLWDTNGKLLATFPHQEQVQSIAFSPKGTYLISRSGNRTRLWERNKSLANKFRQGQNGLFSLKFSPKGDRILSEYEKGKFLLFDENNKEVFDFSTLNKTIASIRFSPKGEYVLLLMKDKEWQIHRAKDGSKVDIPETADFSPSWKYAKLFRFDEIDEQSFVVYTPDGDIIVMDFSGEVKEENYSAEPLQNLILAGRNLIIHYLNKRILNLEMEENEESEFDPYFAMSSHIEETWPMLLSPDGTYYLHSTYSGKLSLDNLEKSERTDFNVGQGFKLVKFTSTNDKIITSSYDHVVRIWDYQGNQLANIDQHKGTITSAEFSPASGLWLTASHDGTVKLWTMESNEFVDLNRNHGEIWRGGFSKDGNYFYTSGLEELLVWKQKGVLVTEGNQATPIQSGDILSADGEQILFVRDDELWVAKSHESDIFSWSKSKKFRGYDEQLNCASFSKDGRFALTASEDGTVKILDIEKKAIKVDYTEHDGSVYSTAFSPNGEYIASGGDDGVARLWDLEGNTKALMKGFEDLILYLAFSPNGQFLLTTTEGGMAMLWDLNGQLKTLFKGHTEEIYKAVFSSDGRRLVTASGDGTAILWDLKGRPLQRFIGHQDGITDVAYSSDGQFIVTASQDATAKIWDLNGNIVADLNGHTDVVSSVSISPDDHFILTTSYDQTAKLWPTPTYYANWIKNLDIAPLSAEKKKEYGIKE